MRLSLPLSGMFVCLSLRLLGWSVKRKCKHICFCYVVFLRRPTGISLYEVAWQLRTDSGKLDHVGPPASGRNFGGFAPFSAFRAVRGPNSPASRPGGGVVLLPTCIPNLGTGITTGPPLRKKEPATGSGTIAASRACTAISREVL